MNSTARGFTIGRLARESGCKVQTIRFYEQIGILAPPARSEGNHRVYSDPDAERLHFIRHCRDLGFSLGAVRELLSLADHPDRPCVAADRIAETHLREVERRIERLRALQAALQRMIDECRGGRIADCRIIEVLADHRHCLSDDHVSARIGDKGEAPERPRTHPSRSSARRLTDISG